MRPEHHPSDDLLLEHVTGALPHPPSLVVDLHLARCQQCRQTTGMLTQVGGVLLEQASRARLNPAGWRHVLGRLSEPEPDRAPPRASRTAWWGPGRRIRKVADDERWRSYLLEAPGGARLPAHHHRGREFTCVLAGGLEDDHGRYGVGDFVSGASGAHRVRVPRGEPCRAVLAIEGGIQLSGMLRPLQLTF